MGGSFQMSKLSFLSLSIQPFSALLLLFRNTVFLSPLSAFRSEYLEASVGLFITTDHGPPRTGLLGGGYSWTSEQGQANPRPLPAGHMASPALRDPALARQIAPFLLC